MTTDTTNALRALEAIGASLAQYERREIGAVEFSLDVSSALALAALATAQPEAKPEGEYQPGDRVRWTNPFGDQFDGTVEKRHNSYRVMLDDGAWVQEASPRTLQPVTTRQAQGGRVHQTPVSGHDPADVYTEAANVDMRQAQGGEYHGGSGRTYPSLEAARDAGEDSIIGPCTFTANQPIGVVVGQAQGGGEDSNG